MNKTDRTLLTVKPPWVLVLGGSGFIGTEVLRALRRTGATVVAGVRRSRPEDSQIPTIPLDIESYDWELLKENPPSAIVHLARISGRRKLSRMLAGWRGRRASQKMIRRLKELDNPPHTVFVSGTLVYGDRRGKFTDETAPLQPVAFQRDYIRAEYPFLDAMNTGLPVSVVRPPWVIGPGSWFQQFYVGMAKKNGRIEQFGDGNQMMSLIHVEDCGSQIADIALHESGGQVFNLLSCEAIKHSEFCRITAHALGADITKVSTTELRRRFGKTVAEALTFSVHAVSNQARIQQFPNRYNSVESAVKASLKALKESGRF